MVIPAHAPWGCFILAMAWMGGPPSRAHENYQELLVSLNARVAAGPQDAGARRERALLFLDHAQPEAAAADLEAACQLEPDHPATIFLRARLDRKSGQLAGALAGLDAYLQKKPEDPAARRERIALLRELGNPRGALAEADLLLSLPHGQEPDDVLLRIELAATPPSGNPAAALTWLEQWMASHPGLMVLEMEALRLELACGRQEPALQRLDRLIRGAQRPEFLLLRKARQLQEWHRLPEARHEAQRCLDAIGALPSHLQSLPVTAQTRTAALAILTP